MTSHRKPNFCVRKLKDQKMERTDLPKVAGEIGRIQLRYKVNSIEKDGERTFNTCVFKVTSIVWF